MATTRLMPLHTGKGRTVVFWRKGIWCSRKDAERLCEFFAEHQEPAAREKTSSAS